MYLVSIMRVCFCIVPVRGSGNPNRHVVTIFSNIASLDTEVLNKVLNRNSMDQDEGSMVLRNGISG